MANERYDIEVQDKVDASIAVKLKAIGDASRKAGDSVKLLKQQLAGINATSLQGLQRVLQTQTQTLNQNATAQQRLQQAQQRTAQATANAQAAQTRANTAATQGATAQQRLAAATAQASAAQTRAATAASRLQQAQQAANKPASPSVGNTVRGAAAVVGVGLSASAILTAADAYTTLQNKLRIVVDTEAQLETVTQRVFDVANRTRTPVQETAQAFTRFDMAMKGLGASQEESLRLTETVNKSLIVSGATSNEAASGLLQLSQAFNKGKLDGEEFRTVMELMPLAADAIAKQMKVTRGELLNLAPQGKITAEVMRKAFANAASGIDAQFAKTVPTINQAMTVLRNSATQFFGELNKSIGFTEGLANAILFLANNMKPLGIGLAVVTAALAVAFGPALVGTLAVATKAVLAFTVALMTNPIGALVVGITAATAAIALYGNQITLTADKNITLKDTTMATLSFIKDGFVTAGSFIRDAWNSLIDFINEKTGGWGEKFRDIGSLIGEYAKSAANFVIGAYVGAYNAIIGGYKLLPGALKDIFVMALNNIITVTEAMVNGVLSGINKITDLANQGSEKLGLGKVFESDLSVSLDKYRMEVTGAASDLAGTVKNAFKSGFDTDYVGNATSAIMKRAKEISNARLKANAEGGKGLRGAGPNLSKPGDDDKKGAATAVRRALALAQINAELDKEIKSLSLVGPERELQSKMDAIEIGLAGKKIKLSQDERAAIQSKVKAIIEGKDAQQALDRVYEGATGPLREYTATQQAANQLLNEGKISAEAFGRAMNVAALQYEDAIDPMKQINREIEQQSALLDVHGEKRAVALQMQNIENALRTKGIALSQQEREQLEQSISALQRKTAVDAEYARYVGVQNAMTDAVTGTNKAYQDGLLNLDAYKLRMADLGKDALAMKLQAQTATFDESMLAGLGRLTDGYKGVADGLSQSFGGMFQTIGDGFADSVGQALVFGGSLKDALGDVARQAVAGLISSLIKLGIQYAVNAAIGQGLAAAATAGSVAQAAIVSTAWATPAALASLATLGTNAVPAGAALMGTVALSQGLSLAGMAGFESGGYTGNVGTKQVAGVVHGQEFVMNAEATKRNRPMLEAMNNGTTPTKAPQSAAPTAASDGSGTRIINVLDPALFEDYMSSPSGEKVIVNVLNRNGYKRN